MSWILAVFLFFSCAPAWAVPAWAETADPLSILELFEAPARELNVPKPLAWAITKVESGFLPWALNVEGEPFIRFDSKEKALEKAREAWAAGRSFDVGLMQINSQWLRRFDIPLEAALDPLANVYFGIWILRRELDRFGGDIRAAVGAYHSPIPARANHYADLVMAALERGPKPGPVGPPKSRPQNIVSNENLPAENHKMRIATERSLAPSGSSMVVSKREGQATPDSAKAAATGPENSMKVKMR